MLPTLVLDEKRMKKELKKDQDIVCLDHNSYLAYLLVSIHRMNPMLVKARIKKGF